MNLIIDRCPVKNCVLIVKFFVENKKYFGLYIIGSKRKMNSGTPKMAAVGREKNGSKWPPEDNNAGR
jgi:hypothetical protein